MSGSPDIAMRCGEAAGVGLHTESSTVQPLKDKGRQMLILRRCSEIRKDCRNRTTRRVVDGTAFEVEWICEEPRGEVTACLMAVKFPDWWSVLALGERCLRLMGKDEFFLVEEVVCSMVFAGIKSLVASCALEQYKEGEAIWCPVVRGHRERVVQMRISALDEETPCFVCLPT
ncbi:hypothetical protein DY000_02009716 [Brassica cretica]|uniref:Uncharacterized protein n=1 Tax=Brassica cretica TaxID=69181 RepID=A0ABQ7CBU4_BRACR|nr:hypothetical protein DY000_02009716 [Brassica cretica]